MVRSSLPDRISVSESLLLDALLIRLYGTGPNGEQVFSVAGAEHRYYEEGLSAEVVAAKLIHQLVTAGWQLPGTYTRMIRCAVHTYWGYL